MQLKTDQWALIGANCHEKAQFTGAIHNFRKALELDPNRHDLRANLADNLRRIWEFDEALVELNYACRNGMFDRAQFIYGCLYLDMGLPEKALTYFTPRLCTTAYARDCRGQAMLGARKWKEGFELREARLEMTQWGNPPVPMWMGEPLEGKRVAIHHEQGYGDAIAYSRWLNHMPKGSCSLGVPSVLLKLMAASFDCPVFNTNEPFPKDVDYYLPIMSLPNRLSISEMTFDKPYISPLGKFDCPMDDDTRLKIGLVWRSKSGIIDTSQPGAGVHGMQKSVPLEQLLPLADIPGVTLYSLQTGGTGEIERLGAEYLIYDLAAKSMDFNDLALFMQEMDLIVSVDTAPLHLAGAMGLDCIGLLSCRGGWPYPGMIPTTPWYPSMTLVRQPAPHDWKGAVDEICATVQAEISMMSQPEPILVESM
jgi:hypothetical protein